MAVTVHLNPNPVEPQRNLDVNLAGLNPKQKVDLATVDANGVESGRGSQSQSMERPRRDGTWAGSVFAPPTVGACKLRVYQGRTKVAEVPFTVATIVVEPPPVEPPPVEPPPVVTPPPTTGKSVRVTSITALLATLADDTVDEIVVANGAYRVAPASSQAATSLWIGSKFASRTRPITVRAESKGGVIIDGGGASGFGGISFQDGAQHQTWDGFSFANGRPNETGVIMFGGYNLAPAHHITLRNITILPSVVSDWATNKDHCIYFSNGGSHDILIEDYTATPTAVASALQFHHPTNAYNVTVRRMHTVGMQSVIAIYESTVHDLLIEDSDIQNPRDTALNVGSCGANVVIRNVTSNKGTYYPSGKPAGLTLVNCSFT